MFNLTINAVPASTIIVGRRATWLDRHAAEELRDYVKKISGTILNIADETLAMAVTGNCILIGRKAPPCNDDQTKQPGLLGQLPGSIFEPLPRFYPRLPEF